MKRGSDGSAESGIIPKGDVNGTKDFFGFQDVVRPGGTVVGTDPQFGDIAVGGTL